MSKEYDVHFIATASDWMRITADSEEEAEKKMRDIVENDFEFIQRMLRDSIQHVEVGDITIDDVLEI